MPSIERWARGLRLAAVAAAVLAIGWGCAEQPTEESAVVSDYHGQPRDQPSPVAPFGEIRMRHLRPEDRARFGPMLVADSSATGKSHWLHFIRYPAEQQVWNVMQHDTAFSRDIYTGAEWYITGAQNGDVWQVSFAVPGGTIPSGFPLQFFDSLGSDRNCFVSGLARLCGDNGILIQSYFTSQCGTAGHVSIELQENGTVWGRDTFYLKNQIDSTVVPHWNQVAFPDDQYADMCAVTGTHGGPFFACPRENGVLKPGFSTVPIQDLGCALTTAVNTLTYFGATTDPATLNTWMKANGGYTSGGGINWPAIGAYSRSIGHDIGEPYYYAVTEKAPTQAQYDSGLTYLRTQVCRYGLPSVRVKHGPNDKQQHWVSVYGRTLDSSSYLINDPNGGNGSSGDQQAGFFRTLAFYQNKPWKVVFWRRSTQPDPTHLGLTLLRLKQFAPPGTATSWASRAAALAVEAADDPPAEILVTDPMGRRLGRDPVTGTAYSEIPDAAYSTEYFSADVDPAGGNTQPEQTLQIPHPVAGVYQIQVIGTDTGSYDLSMQAMYAGDLTGSSAVPSTPTWTGAVHTYSFTYAPSGGADAPLDQGAFSGGGQSEVANGLITYSVPGTKTTTVPAGVTSVPVTLYLSPDVVASSVSLLWNGQNVTPAVVEAGTAVRLMLPVTSGRNIFQASANGVIGGRPKSDSDRLVFLVP